MKNISTLFFFSFFLVTIASAENSPGLIVSEDLVAHADQFVGDNESDKSKVDELSELFDKGTLPDTKEMMGWYAGRCYFNKNPDVPVGAVLLTFIVQGPDHGPVFPRTESLKITPLRDLTGVPSVFDNPNTIEKNEIWSLGRNIASKMTDAKEDQGSIFSSYLGDETEFRVRRSNDFLVLRFTNPSIDGFGGHCYYFKKVE